MGDGFALAACSTQTRSSSACADFFRYSRRRSMSNLTPETRSSLGMTSCLKLLDHVLDHVRRDLAIRHIGRLEHDRFALVLLAQQLEPFHEGEAAGVGQQQHVRVRQLAPFGPILPFAIMPISDFT